MAAIRFTTTQLRGLHAAGRTSDLQHSLISALLARHLGERYAHLLAEFEVRGSDSRDWFVPASPVPVRISALSPDRQAALRGECDRMVAAIGQLATSIELQGANGKNLARVLRDATVYPDEDLWEYQGAPLILNWGFRRSTIHSGNPVAIAEEIVIAPPETRAPSPTAAAAPAPAASVASPAKPRFPWSLFRRTSQLWLWLLFVALLGSIYAMLLPACGVSVGGWRGVFGNCRGASAAQQLTIEGMRLQRQVETAELDLARQKNLCQRPPDARKAANDADFVKQVATRLPAGTVRGATEIVLLWQGTADLDLIIECPDGGKLWRGARSACGGNLLQDMNLSDQSLTSSPIEYAAWNAAPAKGNYKISVELFSYRTAPAGSAIPFRIGIKSPGGLDIVDGQEITGRGTRVVAISQAF
jgi:hypothetical protein